MRLNRKVIFGILVVATVALGTVGVYLSFSARQEVKTTKLPEIVQNKPLILRNETVQTPFSSPIVDAKLIKSKKECRWESGLYWCDYKNSCYNTEDYYDNCTKSVLGKTIVYLPEVKAIGDIYHFPVEEVCADNMADFMNSRSFKNQKLSRCKVIESKEAKDEGCMGLGGACQFCTVECK